MATATLLLHIVDGARQPFLNDTIVRLFDGAQRPVHQAIHKTARIRFLVPFTDGPNDIYRIVVSADDHLDAGHAAVPLRGDAEVQVDVMMLPRKSRFRFEPLSAIGRVHPRLEDLVRSFLRKTLGSDDQAAYEQLEQQLEEHNQPGGLATLFSITSGFAGFGPVGIGRPVTPDGADKSHPLDFVEELQELRNDRFFAKVRREMLDWLSPATRTFGPAPHGLHPGSFISFKEIRYPEGNVQFTFSTFKDPTTQVEDPRFLTLDSDIDLFGDQQAHLLIEVLPTDLLHLNSGTDPRQAYAFRWMSVQRVKAATGLDFAPPFGVTDV